MLDLCSGPGGFNYIERRVLRKLAVYPPAAIRGPFYLWGYFPPLPLPTNYRYVRKERIHSNPARRAKVPYIISHALGLSIQRQGELWPTT